MSKLVYLKCPSCGKVFDKSENIGNNAEGALEGDCPFCKKRFAINKTVMCDAPGKKTVFICPECKKEFPETPEGKDVILVDDDGGIVKAETTCIHCNKQFKLDGKTMREEKV